MIKNLFIIFAFLIMTSSAMSMGELAINTASDVDIANEVGELIQSEDIPMIDFVIAYPRPDKVIELSGTLKTEKDIKRVIDKANSVKGANKIIDNLIVGDFNFMYNYKIRRYLDRGYEELKFYSSENKIKVIKHMDEFLYYRDEIMEEVVKKVNTLNELLKNDLDNKITYEWTENDTKSLKGNIRIGGGKSEDISKK